MATKPKTVRFPELILDVDYEKPSGEEGYGHVRASIKTESGDKLWSHEEDRGGKFNGVKITSQTDYNHLCEDGPTTATMYGYAVEWETGRHTDLTELLRGVDALSEIEKKLSKISKDYGYPASFGAWIQRVCAAIGLNRVRIPNREFAMTPDIAAYSIDNTIHEWRESARAIRQPALQSA